MPDAWQPEDSVLVTRHGRIGVNLQANGVFKARSQDVLSSDQYLQGGLLSDDQTRRSQILAQRLEGTNGEQDLAPILYFWTPPWDCGFHFTATTRQLGAALVAAPVQLDRPPAGTSVSLPSPWLPYRETSGLDGFRPTGFYDYRRGQWSERATPSTAWLRFEIPRVLRPLQLTSGRITVRVTGPVGKLELAALRDDDVTPLKTWLDPVGTLSLDLQQEQLPLPDPQGGIVLRVTGGDPDRPELTNPDPEGTGNVSYWKIESLALDLQGLVLEREIRPESP